MSVELGCWIIRRGGRSRLQENNGSPRRNRQPDEGEKKHRGPEESHERTIRIHDLHSLLFFIRTGMPICNRLNGTSRIVTELTLRKGSPILGIRVAGGVLTCLTSSDTKAGVVRPLRPGRMPSRPATVL